MAKQSFKTAVGAFVIGGLALLVAGIILLGGGRMFSDDIEYVLYFDGSVSGLNIGAPVVFRGVPMGQVTRISLEANPRDASVTIPVYIRLDENSIVRAGVTGELTDNFRQEILRRLIQHGLRASTPDDFKKLKATVQTFPKTSLELDEVLTTLGTGEAVVTVLDPKGNPTPVTPVGIWAPASVMGPASADTVARINQSSVIMGRYRDAVNPDSAEEKLERRAAEAQAAREEALAQEAAAKEAERAQKEAEKEAERKYEHFEKMAKQD